MTVVTPLRTSVALITALGAAVGCGLILGIEDKPVRRDADASDATAVEVDRCQHAFAPPATGADEDPTTRGTYVVAVRRVAFGGEDAGVLGFDLDGTCTCAGTGGAHDASASCSHPTGAAAASCDGDGGIDNALGALAPVRALVDTDIDSTETDCGRWALLFVLLNYNGLANDSDVQLGPVLSPGIDQPHEVGEAPSGCNEDGLVTVYAARWDGTDEWSSDTTFVPKKSTIPFRIIDGFVRDWVLVARAGQTPIDMPIGPAIVEATQATVVAQIEPLDDGLAKIGAGARATRIRLRGQIAGRVAAPNMLKAGAAFRPRGAGPLCPTGSGASFYEALKSSLCGSLDVMVDPQRDFTGAACDAVSAGVSFTADPARMSRAKDAVPTPPGPCPDTPDSCN